MGSRPSAPATFTPTTNKRFAELAKLDPALFVRGVRTEVAKVTWPSRRETLITTGLVLAMSALAAVFFLLVDQLIALAMRSMFGFG